MPAAEDNGRTFPDAAGVWRCALAAIRVLETWRLLYSESPPSRGGHRCRRRDQFGRSPHQADVPTQEELSAQDAWIPRAHVESRRTAGDQGSAPQGAQALDPCERRVNRRHRLRGRGRFAAVRRSGAEARCGVVRVRALARADATPRAGIAVVGARTAVERNRARRRTRALLGHALVGMSGMDAVVWVQAAALRLDHRALEADLGRAVRSAAQRCAAA